MKKNIDYMLRNVKSKKITPEEMLEMVQTLFKPLIKRIKTLEDSLKEDLKTKADSATRPEKEINFLVDGFIIDINLKGLNLSIETSESFKSELRALMIKYKIYGVIANLIKKF